MKIVISILLLISACFAEKLILAADLWPPFNGEPGSTNEGILVEIAKLSLQGYEIEYKIIPWSRALKEARDGKIHGVVGAAKADAPDFIFPSEPQSRLINSFFYVSDWEFQGLKSLEGKILGVMQDYTYGDLITGENLDEYIKQGKGIETLVGDSPLESAIKMLLAGRIDVVVEHPYTFMEALKRLGEDPTRIKSINSVTKPQDLYIAFSPSLPQSKKLAELVSLGTKDLRDSGKLAKILERYGVN